MEPLFYLNEKMKKKPIIIFGTGAPGKACLNELLNYGVDVEGFCDAGSEKIGTIIQGKRVFSMEELLEKRHYNVVITSEDYEAVAMKLKKEPALYPFLYRDIYFIDLFS